MVYRILGVRRAWLCCVDVRPDHLVLHQKKHHPLGTHTYLWIDPIAEFKECTIYVKPQSTTDRRNTTTNWSSGKIE
ncbi:hypothetical protein SCLCIDRAFT_1210519 [Scleroderma citrinum Foug A]|uniref:Uncharacterized protein n=1 Tax=Scleroderma citrinum Foug A TaxID=1036808 RepID=A0A0C3AQ08_9AGAM|nr:hypothetical protein SCLCIDRAFT_1210519 [Scleroderma citrinum Foug A]